jgi:hypothetical protein
MSEKHAAYKVVAHETITELEMDVESHLGLGWKCQGGVAILRVDDVLEEGTGFVFYQSMTLVYDG